MGWWATCKKWIQHRLVLQKVLSNTYKAIKGHWERVRQNFKISKKFAEIDLPNLSGAPAVGPLEGSWEGVIRALKGVGGRETGLLRCSSGG